MVPRLPELLHRAPKSGVHRILTLVNNCSPPFCDPPNGRLQSHGGFVEFIRSHAVALPHLAKFALAMAIIVGVPRLSRRLRLPSVVGLLLCGVLIGPHVLGIFPVHPSVADFFADLGKLLLMFFAGLEIDLALFRRAR